MSLLLVLKLLKLAKVLRSFLLLNLLALDILLLAKPKMSPPFLTSLLSLTLSSSLTLLQP